MSKQLYQSRVYFLWWRLRDPNFAGYVVREISKRRIFEPYLKAGYPAIWRPFLRIKWVALRR